MNRISFLNRGYAFKGLLAVCRGLMCLAQHSAACGDRTQGISIRSPMLYHYATELPEVQMRRDTRKPVFGVSDQVRHKLACAATEDEFGFKKKRNCTIRVAKTKALISCAVTAFCFRIGKTPISHDAAQMKQSVCGHLCDNNCYNSYLGSRGVDVDKPNAFVIVMHLLFVTTAPPHSYGVWRGL